MSSLGKDAAAMDESIASQVQRVRQELLPTLHLRSHNPYNPVVVYRLPPPWNLLGTGNYAAVFAHPDYPDTVVKVYAPGRPGIEAEADVYYRLKEHAAFSECYFCDRNFLILKRLHGTTLYDCLHQGLAIPYQVIDDIDEALDYARSRGLNPHDVHGRNVMMHEGRGLVVDVSDFLKPGLSYTWTDLKRAYRWLYRPIFRPLRLRVPYLLLDGVRGFYRWLQKLRPKQT